MPREITTLVYQYDELSPEAQSRARDWFLEGGLDYKWWEAVYDDAQHVGEILGIRIEDQPGNRGPAIWFSDLETNPRCAFNAQYAYQRGCARAIRRYAPQDTELHGIADKLVSVQKEHHYALAVQCDGRENLIITGSVYELNEIIREFARWIIGQLRAELEYLMSDENVAETIRANEYEFDVEGKRI